MHGLFEELEIVCATGETSSLPQCGAQTHALIIAVSAVGVQGIWRAGQFLEVREAHAIACAQQHHIGSERGSVAQSQQRARCGHHCRAQLQHAPLERINVLRVALTRER